MQNLTLRNDRDPSSLVASLDTDNNRGVVLARISDDQVQVPYLELNFQDLSVSLLNSSDIGLTVDNAGLTTIQRVAVNGVLYLQNPGTGNWFSYQPDENGNLVPTPVSGSPT